MVDDTDSPRLPMIADADLPQRYKDELARRKAAERNYEEACQAVDRMTRAYNGAQGRCDEQQARAKAAEACAADLEAEATALRARVATLVEQLGESERNATAAEEIAEARRFRAKEAEHNLDSLRARLSEVERERDQLVNVCKLAEVLIQPTDDGPQLIGHSSFRERLMHAVRYNKPVAESDIPNPVAAPVQRDANPLGRYADFTEQQCREALANISGVLCDLDYCAVPADPREYGRALREWLARSDTKAVQRDGGKGRDETKPPPGWRLRSYGEMGWAIRDRHCAMDPVEAWRRYDAEHGYAPHPSGTEGPPTELRTYANAAENALNLIAKACGFAREWDYPLQVVRDVEDRMRELAELRAASPPDSTAPDPSWLCTCGNRAMGALCTVCKSRRTPDGTAPERALVDVVRGTCASLVRHAESYAQSWEDPWCRGKWEAFQQAHSMVIAHAGLTFGTVPEFPLEVRMSGDATRPPDGTTPERARIVVTVPPGVNAEELQGAVVSGIAASNMRTADYEAAAESVRIEPAARPHDGMPGERCPSCGGQPRGDGLRCSYCGGEGTRAAYDRVTLGMPGEPARCGHRYTHTEVIAGRQRVTCLDCREWMPVGIPVDAPPTVPGEPPLSGCTDEGHRQSAEARAIRDAFIATREPPAPPTVPGEPARCEFCDGDTSEGQWSICRNCMGCLSQTRAAPPTVPGEPPHDADLLRIFREHEDGGWVVNATTRATIFSESEARRMAAALAAPPTPPRAPVDEAARADERTAVLQYLDERVREERKYPSRDTGVIACIAAAIRAGEHTDSAKPIDAPVDEAAVRADERSCWALAAREEADFHMRIPTEASQRAAAALKGLASAMEADALDTYAKFHNNRRPRTSGPTPEGAAR